MKKYTVYLSSFMLLFIGLILIFILLQFYKSLPQINGTIKVAGLHDQVQIVRDANGVPHIFGRSDHDVYFGLGFAQAQDRFFQMDLTRRLIHGRLCELAGEKAIKLDAVARIRGYPRVAAAIESHLNSDVRLALQAFTDGVNARLKQGSVSPEYALMFLVPEPWKVVDSVAVALAMTDNLVGGYKREVAKAGLAMKISLQDVDEFFPNYPNWAPRTIEADEIKQKTKPKNISFLSTESSEGAVNGSNAWLLSGSHTESGLPLLANDPHLALGSPGPFYLVHLALADGERVGATLPGEPFIVIGRNNKVGWSNTTNPVDVEDIIMAPEGGFKNIIERTETIKIRDKLFFTKDLVLKVRQTDRGPILDPEWFDLSGYKNKDVVLKSIALDPENGFVNAVFQMGNSKNVKEFIAASKPWSAPMTNILVADVEGNIGLVSTGHLPLRNSKGEWVGTIPWLDQPNFMNPKSGFFITANNLITPNNYPYPMPGHYSIYRQARIHERLNEKAVRNIADANKLQNDFVSVYARMLLPLFLEGAKVNSELAKKILIEMQSWNAEMSADSSPAIIFVAWMKELSKAIYADELGKDLFEKAKGPRPDFIHEVLSSKSSHWCDNIVTRDKIESCNELKGPSLEVAIENLSNVLGRDPSKWAWGAVHQAVFKHALFTGVPLLDFLFTTRIRVGGDGDTVFPTVFSYEKDYSAYHGPGMRMIIDFSDFQKSKFIMAPGESGHPWSPYFRNLVQDWANGGNFEIRSDWNFENRPNDSDALLISPL